MPSRRGPSAARPLCAGDILTLRDIAVLRPALPAYRRSARSDLSVSV